MSEFETEVIQRDTLDLSIKDKDFLEIAKKLVEDTNSYNNKELKLKERRKTNLTHYLGKQAQEIKYKPYQLPYVDNILYESIAYQKPMALSRFPDFIVTPGTVGDEISERIADALSDTINKQTKIEKVRKVFGLAFKHRPVYLVGVAKVFWNPEKGKNGDWDIKNVHPDRITFDHTAMSSDVNQMQFVDEEIEYTVREWIMRFPKKKDEFISALREKGLVNKYGDLDEVSMNSKVKGHEFWFVQYEKKGDGYQRVVGVAWYYEDVLLGKMKHPYWDWEGDETTYTYDMKKASEEELREDIFSTMMGGQSSMLNETTYKNYMEKPEFPYILFTYDQWGEGPLDVTTDLEQNIPLQKHYDKRGMQVTDMLNRSRGKNVWSGENGMKASDVQKLDPNNPDQDLFVPKGDIRQVHSFIPAEQPSAQMINDKTELRNRIFDKMGTNSTVRGEIESDTATTNQIAREGAFGKMDDVVEETINQGAQKLADWIMQFMKLFYTEQHFTRTLGQKGAEVHDSVTQDYIEDGMVVEIKASGTDKLKAEQRAMDMAKMQMIDPKTFYEDLRVPDPVGRAKALVMFMVDPMLYLQEELEGRDTAGQVDALNGDGASEATQAIMQIQQGVVPPPPQVVGQGYFDTFNNFMQSGEVEQILAQFPQIKEQLIQFAKIVGQIYQQSMGQPTANGTPPSGVSTNSSPAGVAVGPTAQAPNPQDTSRVAVTPPTSNMSMV